MTGETPETQAPAESPLDRLMGEMRAHIERVADDPTAIRECAIVVEIGKGRRGPIVVSCSDPRPWVGKAFLQAAIDEIDRAKH